jgi:hypothetical protein
MRSPIPRYTPELTEGMLEMIRRRRLRTRDQALADTASDFTARGGTGSSTEAMTRALIRSEADQGVADSELEFLLGAADRSAEDRRFATSTGLDLLRTRAGYLDSALGRQFNRGTNLDQFNQNRLDRNLRRNITVYGYDREAEEAELQRQFEEEQAQKYMAYLEQIRSAERRRARRSGTARAVGAVVGGGTGAYFGGTEGARVGSGVGSELGFLFA